jgi:hypothetical protein
VFDRLDARHLREGVAFSMARDKIGTFASFNKCIRGK